MVAAARFKWENLGDKTDEGLVELFKAHKSIDLSANALRNIPAAYLMKIVQALPQDLISLDVCCNELGKRPTEELIELFTAFPKKLISINLRQNSFNNKTTNELILMFSALPQSLNSISLNFFGLNSKTDEEAREIFRALPEGLTFLDLGWNVLNAKTGMALAVFPKNLKGISLNALNLGSLSTKQIVDLVTMLPESLASIGLGANGLGEKSAEDLVKIFSALPQNLTSIDLRYNQLAGKAAKELVQIFAALPKTLISINLSWNGFNEKTAKYLVKIFSALPKGLTSIDLTGNEFKNKSTQELIEILKALPGNVKHIKLDESDIIRPLIEYAILKEYLCSRFANIEIISSSDTPSIHPRAIELSYNNFFFERYKALKCSSLWQVPSLIFNVLKSQSGHSDVEGSIKKWLKYEYPKLANIVDTLSVDEVIRLLAHDPHKLAFFVDAFPALCELGFSPSNIVDIADSRLAKSALQNALKLYPEVVKQMGNNPQVLAVFVEWIKNVNSVDKIDVQGLIALLEEKLLSAASSVSDALKQLGLFKVAESVLPNTNPTANSIKMKNNDEEGPDKTKSVCIS